MNSPPRSGSTGRAFSLVELLVVIAILCILAGLILAVFGKAQNEAKKITCISNLHQLGTALLAYRVDWDDKKPIDNVLRKTSPWERQAWVSLKPYVKNDEVFLCPEEPRYRSQRLGYIYRAFITGPKQMLFRVPLGTDSTSMTVWCMSHLKTEPIRIFEGDNPIFGPDNHYEGTFLFLRNDASASHVNAKGVDTYFSDGQNWYIIGSEPPGGTYFIRTERFPGEPWPPEFQQ